MANEQLTTDYGQWWHGQTRISFVRGSAQLTTDDWPRTTGNLLPATSHWLPAAALDSWRWPRFF